MFRIILLSLLIPSLVLASVTVSVNGTNYTIPQTNEKGWGANVTSWIQGISGSSLQKNGGNFYLSADVNFGTSFGLISPYYKSTSANIASSGVLRLSNSDSIGFRNLGNSLDLLLTPNATDGILNFNGVPLVGTTLTQTLTNKTLTSPVISSISNTGTLTLPTSSDTLVGRVTVDTLQSKSIYDSNSKWINAADNTKTLTWSLGAQTTATTVNLATQGAGGTLTLPAGTDNLVSRTSTDTLTNKTLTSPVISSISNTGVLTLPVSTDTLVGRATTDTLTNKTIDTSTNTIKSTGAAASAVLTADGANGTSWVAGSASPDQSYELSGLGLLATVATNNLTVALKQKDGATDPTAGAKVKIGFRNATATTGGYAQGLVSAALSVTAASGASFGLVNAVAQYLYVYAQYNAGTPELCLSSYGGFDDGTLQTTTTISAAATANTILYCATGRASQPIRLIGRILVNEATAGTYASAPTEVSLPGFQMPSKHASWSGYHDNTCSWATANTTSFLDFAMTLTCNFIQRTNYGFGTVVSYNDGTVGHYLPGVTFTPPRTGRYYVCASTGAGDSSTSAVQLQLSDGTTEIAQANTFTSAASSDVNVPLCGIYNITSTALLTLKIKQKGSGGNSNINTLGTANAIEWSIYQID